jgi:transposase InsO family protein
MIALICFVLALLASPFKSKSRLEAENAVLRHQLIVLRRNRGRAQPTNNEAERLIGSIRRECLDHIIVSGEAHLRRILISYADYYNSVRTHQSLHKDAPIYRPIQQTGIVCSHPILRGLHHHYVRV